MCMYIYCHKSEFHGQHLQTYVFPASATKKKNSMGFRNYFSSWNARGVFTSDWQIVVLLSKSQPLRLHQQGPGIAWTRCAGGIGDLLLPQWIVGPGGTEVLSM